MTKTPFAKTPAKQLDAMHRQVKAVANANPGNAKAQQTLTAIEAELARRAK